MILGELRQTGAGLLDVQFGHFHVVGTRPGLGTSQGILRLAHPGVGVAHPGFRLIAQPILSCDVPQAASRPTWALHRLFLAVSNAY